MNRLHKLSKWLTVALVIAIGIEGTLGAVYARDEIVGANPWAPLAAVILATVIVASITAVIAIRTAGERAALASRLSLAIGGAIFVAVIGVSWSFNSESDCTSLTASIGCENAQ